MIGLALVTFVTVFAAGLKGSIADAIDESFQGELVIQNTDGFSPIPTAAAAAVRQVPGVADGLDPPDDPDQDRRGGGQAPGLRRSIRRPRRRC